MEHLWLNIIGTISSFAMCIMTYYVYRLTNKGRRIDVYFEHIIELYYKIEEDVRILYKKENSLEESSCRSSQDEVEQSLRRIKVYSTSMCYYINKIPGYADNRLKLLTVLINISREPNDLDSYEKLANELQSFCWELKENKIVQSLPFEYDGRPLSN